jgi:hypothetical protein
MQFLHKVLDICFEKQLSLTILQIKNFTDQDISQSLLNESQTVKSETTTKNLIEEILSSPSPISFPPINIKLKSINQVPKLNFAPRESSFPQKLQNYNASSNITKVHSDANI